MRGITASTALWYASRATGVIALVLLRMYGFSAAWATAMPC